jgi:DNA polymerase-4
MVESVILHIDMDAFYASVEERDCPALKGHPVIVGGDPEGRGVVAAANYMAREFGVHSAMPAATARRLCPKAAFLRPRLDYYTEISRQIHVIFERYTPVVEPLSLDEAFLDVTASQRLFGDARTIGKRLKKDIAEELMLVGSVGIAPNKFLAKLASDLEKPDGLVVVTSDGVQAFLDPLPVGCLWGVGGVSGQRFERMGIHCVKQLRAQPIELMRSEFGRVGERLWRLARGIDERSVVPDRGAKSISHETTFNRNVHDVDTLRRWLLELTEQVARRLRHSRLRARSVHLKVRFADFRTIVRSQTLGHATSMTQEIWRTAIELLNTRLPEPLPPVRLLGIGVSGIEDAQFEQAQLFDEESRINQEKVDAVIDAVNDRYGSTTLRRALAQHGARVDEDG